jgi:hypothetical protein
MFIIAKLFFRISFVEDSTFAQIVRNGLLCKVKFGNQKKGVNIYNLPIVRISTPYFLHPNILEGISKLNKTTDKNIPFVIQH